MTIRVCRSAQVFFLLVVGLSASSYADGIIYHQAPSEAVAQEPLTLEAVVEVEDAAVVSVNIFYRLKGQLAYMEVPMSSAGGGLYFGTIPAGDVAEAGLEYYLLAVLDDESVLAFPVDDLEVNPLFIAVKPAAKRLDVEEVVQETAAIVEEIGVLILSPEPRAIYLPENVVVAASLFGIQDLDASSIRVLVDGKDVTKAANVSADLVTYVPPALATGGHQVEIRLNRASGVAYDPVVWRFLVTGKAAATTARAYQHSGLITPSYRRNNVDNQVLEVSNLKMSYRGGWEWLRVRGDLKLSSEEDAFKTPRNRYFASFQTPVLTLGIGDVTPRFDRFGLDSKRLRGYDANLTLGYLNLRVAQGQLERVIQGRPELAYQVTDYDPDANSLSVSRSGYTFQRDVLAIRPTIGSGQRFQLGLSFIKARDNVPSVNTIIDDGIIKIDSSDAADDAFARVDWIDDSLHTIRYRDLTKYVDVVVPDSDWVGKTPQDNLVIGADLSLALARRRFVVQAGGALSMLNRNIWDPTLTLAALDTLLDDVPDDMVAGEMSLDEVRTQLESFGIPADFTEFEHIYQMGIAQVPLVPIDPTAPMNLSTISKLPSLAYHLTTKINYLRNFITLQYQQVGPEFNSLANPNLQKNVRIWNISDRIRMFRNRLFISALYRATDDNIVKLIKEDDPETPEDETKESDPITTTQMMNLSANINLGQDLPSLSLGMRTYERNNGVDTVSTDLAISDGREHSRTTSRSIGLSYRLQLLASTHDLNLNLAKTLISDQIEDRRADDPLFVPPSAVSNILSLSARSRFSDRLETNVMLATNRLEVGEGDKLVVQDIFDMDASARYILMNGRLSVRGGVTFTNSNNAESESEIAPPSFTRFGIKSDLNLELIENLRLITTFDFKSKQVEGRDAPLPYSVIAANLEYIF
ncbi:MAG: hypothetical protein ACETWG_01300 [Candidatus Neomarinimicrobiota bacterium]